MRKHEDSSDSRSVQIGGAEIVKVTYKGEQVVTFAMIDRVHKRPEGTAKRNFNENRERFAENEDCITLTQPDEIRTLGFSRPQGGTPASVVLVTRRGYLKIVKSLNDDLAWQVFDEMIERYFVVERQIAAADDQTLTRYDASVIGNIVKNCTGVVIREQLEVVLPALIDQMVAAKLAEHNMMIRYGKTAGQIWSDYHLPKIKNGPTWLGNRLAEGDCLIAGAGRADFGGRAVRLFDPDKAAIAMKNGLTLLARQYVEERKGQRSLFPIRGGRADEGRSFQ